MNQFIEWLNANPWLNLVFLILSIISILISFILYYNSKKEKLPLYTTEIFQLVEDKLVKIPSVEILFKGSRINNLSLSKVALWNKGRDSINAEDVAQKNQIKILCKPNASLLGADIAFVSNEANNFSLTPNLDKGEITISFDYFHTFDGVIINVYHTGKEKNDITVTGTIKGAPKIQLVNPEEGYLVQSFADRIVSKLLPKNIKSMPLIIRITVLIILFILLLPILPLLIFLDMVIKPFRTVPKQFRVS